MDAGNISKTHMFGNNKSLKNTGRISIDVRDIK